MLGTLLLILLLALVVALLAIYLLGRAKFRVVAQTPEPVEVKQDTPFYQASTTLLDSSKQAELPTAFYPLGPPHKALLARMQLMENAQHTLDIKYYMVHGDDTGHAFFGAMLDALKRGVKVRLIMDDIDTLKREPNFIRLVGEYDNLQVRIFNPLYLRNWREPEFLARFFRVTRRMHNKSFTADGIASILGGRNIGNEYFNINTDAAFADFDFLFIGNVAAKVTKAFNDYWYSGVTFDIEKLGQAADDETYKDWLQTLEERYQTLRAQFVEEEEQVVTQLLDKTLDAHQTDAEVIYDPAKKILSSPFATDDGNMADQVIELLDSAENDLMITTPYFIPSDSGLDLLKRLHDRGVRITVLTNSFSANDVSAVHAAYLTYRPKLLDLGVELYELKVPDNESNPDWTLLGSHRSSLHAKAFFIDNKRIFAGSFNLDPRSAVHNTEMGVIFDNEAFADYTVNELRRYAEHNAYRVTRNEAGKLQWEETDGKGNVTLHTKEPRMSVKDYVFIRTISFLPVHWLL